MSSLVGGRGGRRRQQQHGEEERTLIEGVETDEEEEVATKCHHRHRGGGGGRADLPDSARGPQGPRSVAAVGAGAKDYTSAARAKKLRPAIISVAKRLVTLRHLKADAVDMEDFTRVKDN